MNIFLLGVLFAIVGALCGILVTKTYSGANFVPSSGCSVVGSSVIPNGGQPLIDDFTDAGKFASVYSLLNAPSGLTASINTNPGRLRVVYDSVSSSYDSNPIRGLKTLAFNGDFSVVLDLYIGTCWPSILFYVDDTHLIGLTNMNIKGLNTHTATTEMAVGMLVVINKTGRLLAGQQKHPSRCDFRVMETYLQWNYALRHQILGLLSKREHLHYLQRGTLSFMRILAVLLLGRMLNLTMYRLLPELDRASHMQPLFSQ